MSSSTAPPEVAPPPTQDSNTPNQTLYCTNLPDRMQKYDLRRALYTLFSTYGSVLDVVALKTVKMRGQAHIVFRDANASTQAMRSLQGFEFFGKELRISYAKGKSNVISRLDGTLGMPEQKVEAPSNATSTQKSIFDAPPGTLPPQPPVVATNGAAVEGAKSPHGLKRTRGDESEEEDGDEDEDGAMAMEESDDE